MSGRDTVKEKADIADDKEKIAYKLDVLCAFEMRTIIVFESEIREVTTKDRLKQYIKIVSKDNWSRTMPLYKRCQQTAR